VPFDVASGRMSSLILSELPPVCVSGGLMTLGVSELGLDGRIHAVYFPRTDARQGNEYAEILCQGVITEGRAIADRESKEHIYGHDPLQHIPSSRSFGDSFSRHALSFRLCRPITSSFGGRFPSSSTTSHGRTNKVIPHNLQPIHVLSTSPRGEALHKRRKTYRLCLRPI
jgi:hypothetical protein